MDGNLNAQMQAFKAVEETITQTKNQLNQLHMVGHRLYISPDNDFQNKVFYQRDEEYIIPTVDCNAIDVNSLAYSILPMIANKARYKILSVCIAYIWVFFVCMCMFVGI